MDRAPKSIDDETQSNDNMSEDATMNDRNDDDQQQSPSHPGSPESELRQQSKAMAKAHEESSTQSPASAEQQRDLVAGSEQKDQDIMTPEMSWDDLESYFNREMEAKNKEEEELFEEWKNLMNFYSMWAQTPAFHEEQRAAKRLRTRIAYVEHEEEQLNEKHVHHDRVMTAFKNALDLLS